MTLMHELLFKTLLVFTLCSVIISRSYAQPTDSIPQKDIVDVFTKAANLGKKQKKREAKRVTFSIIPIAASSSGGKQVLVSTLRSAFYLGDVESTYLSSISLVPYIDFKGSGGIVVRPNLWTNGNKWNITGELGFAKVYLYTYGLGANTSAEAKTTVEYNRFRLYSVFHRKVIWNFFVGAGLDIDQFYSIKEIDSPLEDSAFKTYGIGTLGRSGSTGLTLNFLRDSRTNSINAQKGFYTTLILKGHDEDFGSDVTWSSLYLDGRKYLSFSKKRHSVLGFWFLYWGTFGDVPYLNLPGTSLDFNSRTGRGYSLGRYRGKQMLYGETEYRFDISANGLWGGVIFTNIQSYTELESEKFEYVKIGAGAGLRLKFDKRSNTNLTLDFGFGKDSFNIRLNLGEVF